MGRNDEILEKDDIRDVEEYEKLVKKALTAKRMIETGFIDLAESILDIHKKKLYRLKYQTFDQFCDEELGFSRQTVYVYILILKIISMYPQYFTREIAIEFGHKKMRCITEGINAIDKSEEDESIKEEKKIKILEYVKPEMSSNEIEYYIEEIQ